MDDLRRLPLAYKSRGLNFSQLDRTDNAAIYTSDIGTFEVIEIKVAEAGTVKFGGKETFLPEREVMPGDEKFGTSAWAFQSEEAARKKYEELNAVLADVK